MSEERRTPTHKTWLLWLSTYLRCAEQPSIKCYERSSQSSGTWRILMADIDDPFRPGTFDNFNAGVNAFR